MKKAPFIFVVILLVLLVGLCSFFQSTNNDDILSYEVDLSKQALRFYLDDNGVNIRNAKHLKQILKQQNKQLVFAMNGGMYLKDRTPQGLYIENGKIRKSLNTVKQAFGNFYMQPNGVFAILNNNQPIVVKSTNLPNLDSIKYATQSGPMLLIDGNFHPKFREGSKNLNIRNGLGVLPNGHVLFAMSKKEINFYDFANFFKSKGCENALYLDGYVSRTYLPSEKWIQEDGNFGVIIAEIK